MPGTSVKLALQPCSGMEGQTKKFCKTLNKRTFYYLDAALDKATG